MTATDLPVPMSAARLRFYSTLLRVRPAQLGDFLKKLLRIRRRHVRCSTGHIFWTDPVSVFGQAVMRYGVYEPQMTGLVSLLLRPADTFVDIGGNEGYFSILASSLCREGRVHCIEPQSGMARILEENVRTNHASVALHRVALSDKPGEVALYLRPSTNTGASSLVRHWKLGWSREVVSATTLDRFFLDQKLGRVRLIKVDCEGAEPLVVEGGQDVVRGHAVDFIAMEYHPTICGEARCSSTDRTLRAAGYVLTVIGGQCVYHLPGLETELTALGEMRVGRTWGA